MSSVRVYDALLRPDRARQILRRVAHFLASLSRPKRQLISPNCRRIKRGLSVEFRIFDRNTINLRPLVNRRVLHAARITPALSVATSRFARYECQKRLRAIRQLLTEYIDDAIKSSAPRFDYRNSE